MTAATERTPAERAFLALAEHCTACTVCSPADRRPASKRDRCETAEELARAHGRLRREEYRRAV